MKLLNGMQLKRHKLKDSLLNSKKKKQNPWLDIVTNHIIFQFEKLMFGKVAIN